MRTRTLITKGLGLRPSLFHGLRKDILFDARGHSRFLSADPEFGLPVLLPVVRCQIDIEIWRSATYARGRAGFLAERASLPQSHFVGIERPVYIVAMIDDVPAHFSK